VRPLAAVFLHIVFIIILSLTILLNVITFTFFNEIRYGFGSILKIKCNGCKYINSIYTGKQHRESEKNDKGMKIFAIRISLTQSTRWSGWILHRWHSVSWLAIYPSLTIRRPSDHEIFAALSVGVSLSANVFLLFLVYFLLENCPFFCRFGPSILKSANCYFVSMTFPEVQIPAFF
jgi:hypothetical protein